MSADEKIDEGLFLRAFVKHESDLRAYARALLPDWEAVEESIQEASVVMWRKIDQLQSEDEFLPWAKTVLRFEILKTRRKYARDKHVFTDELIEMLAVDGLGNTAQSSERQAALQKCLRKLSAPNRELVLAPYAADTAVTRIAEKSGRTVNSLYKLMGRLRHKLRKCVESGMKSIDMDGATA